MSEDPTLVAKVHFHCEDKIGKGPPTYSSVSYGFSITREVVDDGDLDKIVEAAKEVSDAVEELCANERGEILKWFKESP